MIFKHGRPRRAGGVTLIEIVVAVTIVSLGLLAFFGALKYITVSLHNSRLRSLATNLGQQQIEYLKGQGYYQINVTSLTYLAYDSYGKFSYDTYYYPPSTYTISGTQFTVYTWVALMTPASNGTVPADASYPDTGEKMLNVNVVWGPHTSAATTHVYKITNMIENSNIAAMDSLITGSISPACSGVRTIQNSNWSLGCQTGSYSLSVVHGSYTVLASSSGYYNSEQNVYAPPGGQVTANFNLVAINSGTITGNVYFNTGLYISQVVASTYTNACAPWLGAPNDCSVLPPPNKYVVEYVELFNPSTYTIQMGAGLNAPCGGGITNRSVILNTNYGGNLGATCNGSSNCTDVIVNNAVPCSGFATSSVSPGRYYLIANYKVFVASSAAVAADAYYSGKVVPEYMYGGVQVCPASNVDSNKQCFPGVTGSYNYSAYDEVAWNGSGGPPPNCPAPPGKIPTSPGVNQVPGGNPWCNGFWELTSGWQQGAYIPTDGTCGLNTGYSGAHCTNPSLDAMTWVGNQLVRYSWPIPLIPPYSTLNLSTPTHHVAPYIIPPGPPNPPDAIRGNWGSAYNSRNNASDFLFPRNNMPLTQGLQYQPFNTSSNSPLSGGVFPIVSGMTTQWGAVPTVWVTTDIYSAPALAGVSGGQNSYVGEPQFYNTFTSSPVTVGTWTVNAVYFDQCNYATPGVTFQGPCTGYSVTCNSIAGMVDCTKYTANTGAQYVNVTQNVSTSPANGATVPSWSNAPSWVAPMGFTILPSYIMLSTSVQTCFVRGLVQDINGVGIPGIPVQGGGNSGNTNAQGYYFDSFGCSAGPNAVSIIVNANNTNPNYTSVSAIEYVDTTNLSKTTTYNFILGPAVTLSGYACTNGVSCTSSALPNLQFIATGYGGYEVSQNATDSTGHFYLSNINSTGTYTVMPALSAGQYSSPSSQSVTFDGTQSNVWVASFTIAGAMATITGTVKYNGNPVASGALIVASTAAVTNPPATMYAASSTAITPVFSVSTLPDGSYALPVMASTVPYNILVWMPVGGSAGPVVPASKFFTITANSGGVTYSGQTLSLP